MQFYPFDTLRIKPNHTIVWLIEQEIAQGCGGYPTLGDVHPKHNEFRATFVGGATDCTGGTVIWEAPFMAAPQVVLAMVSALKAPTPSAAVASPLPNYVSCFACGAEGVKGEVPHTGDCHDIGSC